MKLLIESAMIFFGTLMAAGLVALGEPASAGLVVAHKQKPPMRDAAPVVASARGSSHDTTVRAQR